MAILDSQAARTRSRIGIALILGASLAGSTMGPVIRLLDEAAGWQVVFYRSASLAAAFVLLALWQRRGRLASAVALSRRGAVGGLLMGMTMCFGTWAFMHTTVANVLFLVGITPFAASLLAALFLGERVGRATWIAICVVFVGVAILAGAGLAGDRLFGDALALGSALAYALFVVVMRAERRQDMLPMMLFGSVVAAIASGLLAPSLAVSTQDLLLCLVLGAGSSFVGYYLIAEAVRYLRAGELTLLGSIEMVLGPTWVWLLVNEVPAATTFVGGVLILAAILSQGLHSIRGGAHAG